eukprot:gene8612-11641_t
MQVLIVNGYDVDDHRSMELESYRLFKDLILKSFLDLNINLSGIIRSTLGQENHYIERRLDQLNDFTVCWEHDNLNDLSKSYCQNFDKIDMIFIGGDLSVLPWAPISTQLVTLLQMIAITKKPCFTTGFGAFLSLYSLATNGTRFHLLNEPHGGNIKTLPEFPRYSIGSGPFPGGWYDNKTGDMYVYDQTNKYWKPSCNIGIHRIMSSSPPIENVLHTTKKYARDDHLLSFDQTSDAIDLHEEVIRIRNKFLNSPYLKGFHSNNFVLKLYPEYYLNHDGGLPTNEQIFVMADCDKGPVLLRKENMILFTPKIEEKVGYLTIFNKIIKNFIMESYQIIVSKNDTQWKESSLQAYLFGIDENRGGSYDSNAHQKPKANPLNKLNIISTIPTGPVRVDPPPISIFFTTEKNSRTDHFALTSSRLNSSIGRRPLITVQNPLLSRHKRLCTFMDRNGYNGQQSEEIVSKALTVSHSENPYESVDNMPEFGRELLSGIVLNDTNIKLRRHNRHHENKFNNNFIKDNSLTNSSINVNFRNPKNLTSNMQNGSNEKEIKTNKVKFSNDLNFNLEDYGLIDSSLASPIKGGFFTLAKLASESYVEDVVKVATSNVIDIMSRVSFYQFDNLNGNIANHNVIIDTNNTNMIHQKLSFSMQSVSISPYSSKSKSSSPTEKSKLKQPSQPRSTQQMNNPRHNRSLQNKSPLNTGYTSPTNRSPMNKKNNNKKSFKNDSSDDESANREVKHIHVSKFNPVEAVAMWENYVKEKMLKDKLEEKLKAQSKNAYNLNTSTTINTTTSQKTSNFDMIALDSSSGTLNNNAKSKNTIPIVYTKSFSSKLTDTASHGRNITNPTPLTKSLADSFMAIQHPLPNDITPRVKSEDPSDEIRPVIMENKQQAIILPTPSNKPFSNYNNIQKKIEKMQKENDEDYQGAYREPQYGYHEKEIKEYVKSKEKFIGGTFKTHFGKASAIPLRQEGAIRGQGFYPERKPLNMPENSIAADWLLFGKDGVDRKEYLAGYWKK